MAQGGARISVIDANGRVPGLLGWRRLVPTGVATRPSPLSERMPRAGGAESHDRIYVVVEPGADEGHVLAWKQGLPPAFDQLRSAF